MNLLFIGAGNMAGALMSGIYGQSAYTIGVVDTDPEKIRIAGERYSAQGWEDIDAAVHWADITILSVKPHIMPSVMESIKGYTKGKVVVSIAAGITAARLRRALPGAYTLRVMPSTPAMVGEGIALVSREHQLNKEVLESICKIFGSVGKVVMVEEKDMTAAFCVSSSGPAFYFLMIEAMADAAVALGITRDEAYRLAAQTALGAGKMALESGQNPAALKDQVASPGGTTIQAILALEEYGARNAMQKALLACYKRAKELESNG